MTIYVDDITEYPNTPLKYKKWSHMATDGDIEELHKMADSLGLKRSWFQDKVNHPHYDLTPSKRYLAIQRGAIPVSKIDLIHKCFPVISKVARGE